jgi:hypothetical protein
MPLACPSCGKLMKIDLYNKKMWSIHQKCFDCVIKMEDKIKIHTDAVEIDDLDILDMNESSKSMSDDIILNDIEELM